jgi:O-antigen/teichoic acid export membrane protein
VISLLAIPAGRFYQNPDITFLLFGIAANGALGSMENIGTVEYRRNLDFSFEFRSRLYSKLSGTFAAVIIAVGLRSYWALILGITASRLFSVIYSYIQCEFRPRIMLTKKRDLLAFSWWMLLSRLVTTISFRFSQLFVGYRFGSASVGHFSMAAELATLATSEVAAPINRVMFSRYSEHGGDLLKITQGFRRISCVIWVIGVPACLGIVVTAPDVIKVLLGPQWKDAAPILQILAIANLFDVMAANTHYVYWAIGRAKFVTALDALTSGSFIILASILALSFGVIGVAVAQAISALLAITINYLTLARTLSVPLLLLLRSQARTLAASFGMTAAVYYIFYSDRGYSSPNALEHLVAAVCSGAAIYILLLYALWMVQRRPDGAESDILQVLRIVLSKYLRPFCGH